MKLKNLFFTAITLCVGFAALSCGSDDDGDGVDTGNTNTVTGAACSGILDPFIVGMGLNSNGHACEVSARLPGKGGAS